MDEIAVAPDFTIEQNEELEWGIYTHIEKCKSCYRFLFTIIYSIDKDASVFDNPHRRIILCGQLTAIPYFHKPNRGAFCSECVESNLPEDDRIIISQRLIGWDEIKGRSSRIDCSEHCRGECLFDGVKRYLHRSFLKISPKRCNQCDNVSLKVPLKDIASIDTAEQDNFQPIEYCCGNLTKGCALCQPDIYYVNVRKIRIDCEEECQGECVEAKFYELTTGDKTKSAQKD